jgi:hypothetical protein
MTQGLSTAVISPEQQAQPFVPWSRSPEWVPLVDPTVGTQGLCMLWAVWEGITNPVALTVSGAYTVDWGDGVGPVSYASGATAQKLLSWSDYSAGTLTSKGYRQAVITVAPQSGQLLTTVNTSVKNTTNTLPNLYSTGLLDLVARLPNATSITFGAASGTVIHSMCEQVRVLGPTSDPSPGRFVGGAGSGIAGFPAMRCFGDLDCAGATSLAYMFQNCYSLEKCGALTNTGSVTSVVWMFFNCSSLVELPTIDSFAAVTNMSAFASGCSRLRTVPLYNTSAVTNMLQAFYLCSSLTSVPTFNTSMVSNMGQAFRASGLRVAPLFDLGACTTADQMFYQCPSLVSIPAYNLPMCTALSDFANGCIALTSVGAMTNTGSVSSWLRAFSGCIGLQTLPMMNTSGATNMTAVVNLCSSLRSIPAWNVANCTAFASAFTGCQSLESVLIVGSRYSMNFGSCSLSSAALDVIYTNLGTASGAQTITVTSNYGTTGDTPSIATAKGWTVTGS